MRRRRTVADVGGRRMLMEMPYAMLCWLLVLAGMACARNPPAWVAPPGGASQTLAIASSGHVLVTAQIDGRPYVMVLDTGANITSLSSRAARELGLETTGWMKINDTIQTPLGTVRSLAIAGLDHPDLQVVVIDHPDAPAGVDGILGLDVLARHDIVVDFVGQRLAVYPEGTLVSSRGDLLPLHYGANGLLLIEISLDGVRVPAMLDLGAPVSVLNGPAGALVGAHGPATDIVARTGDIQLEPVRALVRDLGTFRRLGFERRPAVVLGTDVFSDRVLAISYRDRVARIVE
jgi:predicted aspartyl protease